MEIHLTIHALHVSISSAISGDKMKKLFCVFVVLALLASSTVLTAQQQHHHRAEGGSESAVLEKLGAVHMPISCAASVQTPFERGIARASPFSLGCCPAALSKMPITAEQTDDDLFPTSFKATN